MNKRGVGLSFETLVVAIIVLVVLGVVIAIFLTQSGKFVGKYSDVAGKAESEAKGCNILFGRYCASTCNSGDKPLGKFEECGDEYCCEKTQNE